MNRPTSDRKRFLSVATAALLLVAILTIMTSSLGRSSTVERSTNAGVDLVSKSITGEMANTSWGGGNGPAAPGWGVACATTRNCIAVGGDEKPFAISTVDGWSSWSSDNLPTGIPSLGGVACSSATNCVAVGPGGGATTGAALVTTNGGTSWSTGEMPQGSPSFIGVSCPSSKHCVAVGPAALSGTVSAAFTNDGGSSWSPASLPDGVLGLDAVSCASDTDCAAVGDYSSAEILVTTDGGSTWTSATPPKGILVLTVSCPSTSVCLAVGLGERKDSADLVATLTTDGGQEWSDIRVVGKPPANLWGFGLSCPTTNHCVTVGGDGEYGDGDDFGYTTGNRGSTWSRATIEGGGVGLTGAVSCPSARDCIAMGAGGSLFTTDGGTSWGNGSSSNTSFTT